MALTEQFLGTSIDFLLVQAQRVFSQRQTRKLMIDADLLGEPGWDILLCAYIAHRKGNNCSLDAVAGDIGLGIQTTRRWVDLLTARDLLIQRNGFFAISEIAETKLSTMFSKQMNELAMASGMLAKLRGGPDQGEGAA